MGSGSSTEIITDPITGETKTKHKLGGAFPGSRRPVNAAYAPPASQFSNGQAISHFVSYGGGNALVLKQGGGPAIPQIGASVATAKPPEYIQVTLPAGVEAGQTIQVAAPDGRLNQIVIPDGFGPGSTFTVEFADEESSSKPSYTSNSYEAQAASSYEAPAAAPVTATAQPLRPPPAQQGNDDDDGFATGFGTSTSSTNYSSYPSATDARPVYR